MDETGGYEEWDLTPVSGPLRSTLYAIRPVGLETAFVEGLTSYIMRLAEVHCIFPGVLISKMMAPLMPGYTPMQSQHTLFPDSGKRSTLVNGTGLPARYAVQALSVLTLRTDLHSLTCLPLSVLFPTKGKSTFRLTRAWCPACYEQWHEREQVLYDPLLWSFQEITHCVLHRQRLSTHCPYQDCGRPLPGVGWRARVGYCSYCQRWLGSTPSHAGDDGSSLNEKEWLWQQWITQAMGEVFAGLPTCSVLPDRTRIQQVIQVALRRLTANNFTAFAQALGLQLATVHKWYQGKSLPAFPILLQLCARLGISLQAMLFQDVETLQPCFNSLSFLEPLAPTAQLRAREEQIYQALEQIVADNKQPPPSLKDIELHLRSNRGTLRAIHPVACCTITSRYQTYVQQRKEMRLQQRQEEIKAVAFQLQKEGVFPTTKRVSLQLPRPGMVRDPQLRLVLEEICQEMGAKDSKSVI